MPRAMLPDVFSTSRLRAQRMAQTHLPFITRMHANVDLMQTMGGTRDAAASRLYVAQNVAHWSEFGYGMYVIGDRETGLLAGRAGLKYTPFGDLGAIELAYALHPDCWGQGYAQEIACALIDLGFQRLPVDVLAAVAVDSNAASRRVMEKTGLRYVGISDDGVTLKVRYEIRRDDWRLRQGQTADQR